MGRMVLEADRLGCADEVIVIAAALSIQDPRERPAEHQAQADQLHARFKRRALGLPRLPQPLALPARAAARAVGQPVPQALQGRVPALPAHPRVAGPRRASCAPPAKRGRRRRSTASRPSPSAHPPRAAVAGCSRTSALQATPRAASTRARAARASRICPGSALARKPQPTWVMVAELVETVAAVGPRRRAHRARVGRAARRAPASSAPTPSRAGSRRRGVGRRDRARRRSTGCRSSPGRTVAYGRIDPALSRELFIRRALVEGDWETRHAFFAANRPAARGGRRARAARAPARHPRRRRGAVRLLRRADPGATSSRARTSTAGGATRAARDPDLLTYTRELLDRRDAAGARPARRPTAWRQGDLVAAADLPLRARRRRRRRDRPRPAQGAAAAARRRASTGWCPRCATSSSPRCSARCPRTCAARSCRCPTSRPQVLERARAAQRAAARRPVARARARCAACASPPEAWDLDRAARRTCA